MKTLNSAQKVELLDSPVFITGLVAVILFVGLALWCGPARAESPAPDFSPYDLMTKDKGTPDKMVDQGGASPDQGAPKTDMAGMLPDKGGMTPDSGAVQPDGGGGGGDDDDSGCSVSPARSQGGAALLVLLALGLALRRRNS